MKRKLILIVNILLNKKRDELRELKAYRDQMRQLVEAMALNIFEDNNVACNHPDSIRNKLLELDIARIEIINGRDKVVFIDKWVAKNKTDE